MLHYRVFARGFLTGARMKIRKLMEILETMDPEAEVFVAFFTADGTSEMFDIEDVTNNDSNALIEIYEEEPAA